MNLLRGIKSLLGVLISLYIFGFIVYNLTPFSYYETYIAEGKLAPKPYVQKIFYLFGVKLNEYPDEEIVEFMEGLNLHAVYGFFPFEEKGMFKNIIKSPQCYLLFVSEASFRERLFSFIFEYLPRKLIGQEYRTIHYHLNPKTGKCNVLAHDVYLNKKFLDFSIDHSRNMVYKRIYKRLELERNVIVNGKKHVEIYAYSPKGFYYPGETTVYPFRIYVKSNQDKVLILIYRNDEVYRIYDTKRVVVKINHPGKYSVKVLSYKFSWHNYYFGLRLVAYSAPITLLY